MTQGFAFELKRSSIGNDKEKLDRVFNAKSATKFMQTIDEVAEYVTDNNLKPFEKYGEFIMYLSFCL